MINGGSTAPPPPMDEANEKQLCTKDIKHTYACLGNNIAHFV